MTDKFENPLAPLDALRQPMVRPFGRGKVMVDMRAFWLALVGAPLVVGCLGAVLVLPGLVVLIGVPATLCIGGPVAWWTISRFGNAEGEVGFGQMIGAGWLAALLCGVIVFVSKSMGRADNVEAVDGAAIITLIGVIVATLQALVFVAIYNNRRRTQADLARIPALWII